jgi:hypothetical protein
VRLENEKRGEKLHKRQKSCRNAPLFRANSARSASRLQKRYLFSASLDLQAVYEAVRNVVAELPATSPSPGAQIESAVEAILSQHIVRAIDAIDRGDNLEAAQAVSQTLAVSAAWIAGTL